MHFYTKEGEARYSVPNKSKGGTRPTTTRDARGQGWLPSPTEVIKTLARPALTEWLIRNAILAFATAQDVEGESLDDRIKRVLDVENQQDQESRAAMDLGSQIHEAIELALAGNGYSPNLSNYVCAALYELIQFGLVIGSEKILVGDGYAGKTDCICTNHQVVTVVDFKTAKNIPKKPYDEALIQIAAYCGALGNVGDNKIDGVLIYISTSNPGEIKVFKSENWPSDFKRFKFLLEFWKISNNFV